MERELQPAPRFDWERMIRRCRLPKDTKLVALTCATYADPDGSRVRPGVPRLAAVTGMGQSTVRRHVAALASLGLLERVSHGGGRHGRERGARWRLTVPSDLLERVPMLDVDETTALTTLGAVATTPPGQGSAVANCAPPIGHSAPDGERSSGPRASRSTANSAQSKGLLRSPGEVTALTRRALTSADDPNHPQTNHGDQTQRRLENSGHPRARSADSPDRKPTDVCPDHGPYRFECSGCRAAAAPRPTTTRRIS